MMFLGLFILLLTFYLSFFCDIIKHKTNHELAYVYDLVWFSVYLPSPTTHIVSTLYADTFVLDTTSLSKSHLCQCLRLQEESEQPGNSSGLSFQLLIQGKRN